MFSTKRVLTVLVIREVFSKDLEFRAFIPAPHYNTKTKEKRLSCFCFFYYYQLGTYFMFTPDNRISMSLG